MNTQVTGLRVASGLFGLLCVAQLMRLAIRPDVMVAGHAFPLWPSMIAVVILGALSIWEWGLSKRAY